MKAPYLLMRIMLVLVAVASSSQALAARRVALLIGNAAYANVAQLQNPHNDAQLIASAFTRAGFDKVVVKFDLARSDLVASLRSFEEEAAAADIAVIYYSGHGIELGGENYVVPTDARLATDRDVEDEAVSLTRILRTVEGAKRLRLVILDACRDNPFSVKMTRQNASRAVARGLARVEPSTGDLLVAYAAKAGTVAWDGDGKNSPFSEAIARRLFERGVDIRIALGRVRDDVLAATNNYQEPFSYGSLGGDVVALWDAPQAGLTEAAVPAPAAVATPPSEDEIWSMVKGAKNAGLIRDFLFRHPDSRFKDEALKALAALEPGPAPAAVTTAPAQTRPSTPIVPAPARPKAQATPIAKVQKPVAQTTRAAPSPKPKAGSNCFTFNGRQYCE
jgi:uncharacterized protein